MLNATDIIFFGVTCVSASDCWAVGYTVLPITGSYYQTLIEHWDGTSWSIVQPSLGRQRQTTLTCNSLSRMVSNNKTKQNKTKKKQ
jgi:hypothetical protein